MCYHNELTSLEFCPKQIGGAFYCSNNELNDKEKKIFFKYQHDMGIWDNGYNEEAAQLLFDDIRDGLL